MQRRPRYIRALACALTPILALGATAPASAVGPVASPMPTHSSGNTAVNTERYGNFRVTQDDTGSTVSWTPAERIASTDARPEIYVNGTLLGVPLGSEHSLQLRVPGTAKIAAKDLSLVRSGKVVDGAPLSSVAPLNTTKRAAVRPTQQTKTVSADPGVAGKYKTTSFTYTKPGIRLDGYAVKSEMKGLVVAPVGAKGKRPVVVFLHGRHGTCYIKGETTSDWPCVAPEKSIPSYRGYLYQQKLLASQGYVTVSISANSINAQDGNQLDSGSAARGVLVREHLKLLSQWNSGSAARPAGAPKLRGTMNLFKVMTVGHSRGGEGVNRAAVKAAAGDPFRIIGQVLIAPTDFARQVAVGVPTTVLLPYCDGDVSDLQGQQYVDQGARLVQGDRSLKTSVLILGANHNFFNTQWTPQQAVAPANDDASGGGDPQCAAKSSGRLTAKQQQAVGATYVAAAAHAYLNSDRSATRLLDGTPVRAKSAGQAVVLTHATGGRRSAAILPDSAAATRASARATSTICRGYVADGSTGVCSVRGAGSSPHWLAASYGSGGVPSSQAWRVSWTKKNAVATLVQAHNLANRTNLDVRVIVDPSSRATQFSVVLRDTKGRSVSLQPKSQPVDLPHLSSGTRYWAQEVRVVLPKKSKVDLAHIASIGIKGRSKTGKVYIVDGYASSGGTTKSTASVTNTRALDVPTAAAVVDPDQATQQVWVTIPIRGISTLAGSVWVETSDLSTGAASQGRSYTVTPGATQIKVPLTVSGDDAYSDPGMDAGSGGSSGYQVTAIALRNVMVDSFTGTLELTNPTPRPTLNVVAATAVTTKGDSLRWTLHLSAPVASSISVVAEFQAPAGGSELQLGDTVPGWARQLAEGAPGATVLSASGGSVSIDIPAYATTATVEIPIRRLASFTSERHVTLVVPADGTYVTSALTLTGTVTP